MCVYGRMWAVCARTLYRSLHHCSLSAVWVRVGFFVSCSPCDRCCCRCGRVSTARKMRILPCDTMHELPFAQRATIVFFFSFSSICRILLFFYTFLCVDRHFLPDAWRSGHFRLIIRLLDNNGARSGLASSRLLRSQIHHNRHGHIDAAYVCIWLSPHSGSIPRVVHVIVSIRLDVVYH